MAEFFWDFGFTFAADEDSRMMSFLPNGPVLNAQASSAQAFQSGDTLTFNIFNRTPSASQTDGTQIIDSKITFTSALPGQSSSTPFNSSISVRHGAADATGLSAIFGSDLPRWTGTAQVIENEGLFEFTVALIIQDPNNGVRVFVVDPEMIVGGTPVA